MSAGASASSNALCVSDRRRAFAAQQCPPAFGRSDGPSVPPARARLERLGRRRAEADGRPLRGTRRRSAQCRFRHDGSRRRTAGTTNRCGRKDQTRLRQVRSSGSRGTTPCVATGPRAWRASGGAVAMARWPKDGACATLTVGAAGVPGGVLSPDGAAQHVTVCVIVAQSDGSSFSQQACRTPACAARDGQTPLARSSSTRQAATRGIIGVRHAVGTGGISQCRPRQRLCKQRSVRHQVPLAGTLAHRRARRSDAPEFRRPSPPPFRVGEPQARCHQLSPSARSSTCESAHVLQLADREC
jgi:hypothetical protein